MATTTAYETELLTTQYTSTLQMLLQQMDSRLRGAVTTGSHQGKMASPVQYIGALQFKQSAGRGAPLVPQLGQYQRRWVFPADKELTVHVDTFDELRTIVDPRSGLTASIQAAANRLFDDVIIASFTAAASMGVDSSSLTTETFNSGSNFPIGVVVADTVGPGAASGMNIAKLIEAKRILRRYENDLESVQLHLAIGAQQEKDLLSQIEVVSTEFNDRPVLVNGRLQQFLGFQIHHSERLGIKSPGASADRQCMAWMQDGMYLGLWKDMAINISQRNDLTGHPWQAYAMISLGATRLQAGKVVEIDCLEANATGDITV